MAVEVLTVVAGASVSSAFELERSNRSVLLHVPSHGPVGWGLAFQSGPLAAFVPLNLDVVTATSVVSFSGGRWLIFPTVPANTGRAAGSARAGAVSDSKPKPKAA
jgi:hypothetical protein